MAQNQCLNTKEMLNPDKSLQCALFSSLHSPNVACSETKNAENKPLCEDTLSAYHLAGPTVSLPSTSKNTIFTARFVRSTQIGDAGKMRRLHLLRNNFRSYRLRKEEEIKKKKLSTKPI